MKKFYQFKAKRTVVEIREELIKMVKRGSMDINDMVSLVRKFSEEKKSLKEGQKFITIIL